ncbi:MAG: tRNA uridine-5-carboxymethylaminomethyl(34) synthesis GTPase MnmE [Candidatus Marinimicrobia bacterium]|nr:tRNA uridine-5-carboxymethylaminomethyl(34) synthesis GTPase MnmE [Candidatus Neomarinimicrobiota bacterium]
MDKTSNNNYPIAAIATPLGIGALAIIRISGFSLESIYYSLTKRKNTLISHKASLCSIYSAINNSKIDSCIIIYYKGPKSFTGEDVIEINCHGGNLIPQMILETLSFMGIKNAAPGEFSLRAFLNNKIDLLQAESLSSLISAKNDLSHSIALKNLSGFFTQQISFLEHELKTLLTILENELNFNENEITFSSKNNILKSLSGVCKTLKKLDNSSAFGSIINSGYRILLLGRPNVGKSSLFNFLLGKNRAIISEVAGTTRDVIEANSEIKNIPVCFVDTAGYWESDDFLEILGIKKTVKEINSADLVLFLDDKDPINEFNNTDLKINPNKLIFVKTKEDTVLINNKSNNFIKISTLKGFGINDLTNQIFEMFKFKNNSGPVITSNRQKNLIKASLKITIQSIDMIKTDLEMDLVVSNIRDILFNLKSLIGKVYEKDVIDDIFNKFCVGK